uniref:Uncharacterized protein n=1 Tax=Oryza sativa subsp. japonica TaxID=39947 RepID=Q69TX1_ORYSJ|nr:hypothetical protein [Oryza sativa Japonica Group]
MARYLKADRPPLRHRHLRRSNHAPRLLLVATPLEEGRRAREKGSSSPLLQRPPSRPPSGALATAPREGVGEADDNSRGRGVSDAVCGGGQGGGRRRVGADPIVRGEERREEEDGEERIVWAPHDSGSHIFFLCV